MLLFKCGQMHTEVTSGFVKTACKNRYTYNCPNFVYEAGTACAECLVSLFYVLDVSDDLSSQGRESNDVASCSTSISLDSSLDLP